MFYSQDILQKRGGKFGIIWLAATGPASLKLNKRDIFSVNVSKTCEDIIMYIVRDTGSRVPRPRFSLYLQSQLMYGVVKVYQRQIKYLGDDASDLRTKFVAPKGAPLMIDLQPGAPHQRAVTLPDNLNADPTTIEFGRFDDTFDVGMIPEIDFIRMNDTAGVFDSPSPSPGTRSSKKKKEKSSKKGHTSKDTSTDLDVDTTLNQADRSTITLPDDPVHSNLAMAGMAGENELPACDGTTLDNLMGAGTGQDDQLFPEQTDEQAAGGLPEKMSSPITAADRIRHKPNVLVMDHHDPMETADMDGGMLPPADKTASMMQGPGSAPPAPQKRRAGEVPPDLPFTPIEPQPGDRRARVEEEPTSEEARKRRRLSYAPDEEGEEGEGERQGEEERPGREADREELRPRVRRRRRGRGRPGLIIDEDMQIHRDVMRGYLGNVKPTLRPTPTEEHEKSKSLKVPTEILFKRPGSKVLMKHFPKYRRTWEVMRPRAVEHTEWHMTHGFATDNELYQSPVARDKAAAQQPSPEQAEEQEHELDQVQVQPTRQDHILTIPHDESMERARDAEHSSSMADLSSSILPGALSRPSVSGINVSADDSTAALPDRTSTSRARSRSRHEVILEEIQPEPELPPADITGGTSSDQQEREFSRGETTSNFNQEDLTAEIFLKIDEYEEARPEGDLTWLTFKQLCPPRVTRRIYAARVFTAILVLGSQKKLVMMQERPEEYSDINISRWPRG